MLGIAFPWDIHAHDGHPRWRAERRPGVRASVRNTNARARGHRNPFPLEEDGGVLLTVAMRLSTVAATRSNRGVWQSAVHARSCRGTRGTAGTHSDRRKGGGSWRRPRWRWAVVAAGMFGRQQREVVLHARSDVQDEVLGFA